MSKAKQKPKKLSPEEQLLVSFRANLARIRTSKGLSQSELARRIKIGASYICDLETGRRSGITAASLAKLADGLGVPPARLLDDPEEK